MATYILTLVIFLLAMWGFLIFNWNEKIEKSFFNSVSIFEYIFLFAISFSIPWVYSKYIRDDVTNVYLFITFALIYVFKKNIEKILKIYFDFQRTTKDSRKLLYIRKERTNGITEILKALNVTYIQLKCEWRALLNSSIILINLLITCILLTFDLKDVMMENTLFIENGNLELILTIINIWLCNFILLRIPLKVMGLSIFMLILSIIGRVESVRTSV